jgi:hypothetical protein
MLLVQRMIYPFQGWNPGSTPGYPTFCFPSSLFGKFTFRVAFCFLTCLLSFFIFFIFLHLFLSWHCHLRLFSYLQSTPLTLDILAVLISINFDTKSYSMIISFLWHIFEWNVNNICLIDYHHARIIWTQKFAILLIWVDLWQSIKFDLSIIQPYEKFSYYFWCDAMW